MYENQHYFVSNKHFTFKIKNKTFKAFFIKDRHNMAKKK